MPTFTVSAAHAAETDEKSANSAISFFKGIMVVFLYLIDVQVHYTKVQDGL